jgi:hypothetical protein
MFHELVGHGAHSTVILAIPLCSWTYILQFYLFGRIVKECHPPVIKEMRSCQKMKPTIMTLLFPAMVRVIEEDIPPQCQAFHRQDSERP